MGWLIRIITMFAAYMRGIQEPVSVNRQGNETGTSASKQMSRQYDGLFRKHGGALPVAFLRALAYSESKLNPDRELEKKINVRTRLLPSGKRDSYWGLFQVGVKNVLRGFNKAEGTNIKKAQLFDADTNTRIAAWQINRIVRYYAEWAERHNIPELRPDWSSIAWVRLLVAGWNSGYSRAGGVQAVALYLKSRGIPVTHDNLYKHGRTLYKGKVRKAKYLNASFARKPHNKRAWQRRVASRYFEQSDIDRMRPKPPGGGLVAVSLFGLLALAVGLKA